MRYIYVYIVQEDIFCLCWDEIQTVENIMLMVFILSETKDFNYMHINLWKF